MIRSRGWEQSVAGWPEFKRVYMATHTRSALRMAGGVSALRCLEQTGIPALAFKGLAGMASLYPAPADRTIGDADVLIEPEHVAAALACLAEIGFHPAPGQEFEKVEPFLDKSPGFAGNKALSLYGPRQAEVDLHWSVGFEDVPPKVMLARCETAELFGSQIRVPTAGDAIALTARHTVRENFTIDKVCRDLIDIGRWCGKLALSRELNGVLVTIQASGHGAAFLAMAQILAQYDGNSSAVGVARQFQAMAAGGERRAAEEVMRVFFDQVENGPLSKDILYLAHTKPLRQIFSGLWANWSEYRGVMRSLEERLEGHEVPLRRRTRLLAGALRSVSPRQFRSIRALAHLKYDF